MPTIQNFPQALLDEHAHWHMNIGDPASGGRRVPAGSPGSGIEFLEFHRRFVGEFHAWYDTQPGADQNAVAPWTAIPPELKVPRARWNRTIAAEEQRIVNNSPPFLTEDELGIFIETTVHNRFIHGAAAVIYNEPVLNDPMQSPLSTYFYKIHGLIDGWRRDWRPAVSLSSPTLSSFTGDHALLLGHLTERVRAIEHQLRI